MRKNIFLLLLPIIYLLWSLLLNLLAGPHSISRSDPEYPYLLNGLNCATLNFNNIGHTDHPGTPFQLFTGITIRITHLFVGQGPVYEDVIARPQVYLGFSSLILSLLTMLILIWLGRITLKHTGKWMPALVLQSSVFLSAVLIDFPLRYHPDRMLMVYGLLFAGLVIKYLYAENFSHQRFAILSGLIMGVGFATKFNFLPLLILPLFILPKLKTRIIYGASFGVSFFISILPILNKFKDFRKFIGGVAAHDGLYGQGAEQMINWEAFFHNLGDSVRFNPALYVTIALSLGILLQAPISRLLKSKDRRKLLFITGFYLAFALSMIMVSKHYKNYYLAPVLSMTGLVLALLTDAYFYTQRFSKLSNFGLPAIVILVFLTVIPLPKQYRHRIQEKQSTLNTEHFITENLGSMDLWFIEPTWMAGPMVENALIYGISYVAHRHQFYREYHQVYPNVLTWEGEGRNPKWFRTVDADDESILKSGRDIYLYDSPGRNANLLLTWLDTLSAQMGIGITKETVFVNQENDDRVIRVRNREGWSTKKVTKGYEGLRKVTRGDEGLAIVTIGGVEDGDYIVATVCVNNLDGENPGRLILRPIPGDTTGIYFEDSHSLQDIGHGWQLLTLRGHIPATPLNSQMECLVYYPGDKEMEVRDLEIVQMAMKRNKK